MHACYKGKCWIAGKKENAEGPHTAHCGKSEMVTDWIDVTTRALSGRRRKSFILIGRRGWWSKVGAQIQMRMVGMQMFWYIYWDNSAKRGWTRWVVSRGKQSILRGDLVINDVYILSEFQKKVLQAALVSHDKPDRGIPTKLHMNCILPRQRLSSPETIFQIPWVHNALYGISITRWWVFSTLCPIRGGSCIDLMRHDWLF